MIYISAAVAKRHKTGMLTEKPIVDELLRLVDSWRTVS